jgi:hypothetical protein
MTSAAPFHPGPAHATCFPVGAPDGWIEGRGQLNLVILNAPADSVHLIPNIRIVGPTSEFALVVPTPNLPRLDPVDDDMWLDAFRLTQTRWLRRSNLAHGLGCGEDDQIVPDPVPLATEEGGVIVHSEETVGAFIATIVSSDEPDALMTWFRDNDFTFTPEDSGAIAPYARRGWFFTAMKIDTTQVTLPPMGWNTSVDPVRFTYAAADFEVPLPVLAINRATTLPMTFFVVDDHRVDLPGFRTVYANRLSDDELRAIDVNHRTLAVFLESGDFFTRLERSFGENESMNESIFLTPAETDDEIYPIAGAAMPGGLAVMAGAAGGFWLMSRRRSRRGSAPPD